MNTIELIKGHLRESAAVKQKLARVAAPAIAEAGKRIAERVAGGGKIMLCGNGGRAADSQHLAAEFTSRLRSSLERPPIAALALTTGT
jgi:D-sedoheptulose 7-phosphate isomerase